MSLLDQISFSCTEKLKKYPDVANEIQRLQGSELIPLETLKKTSALIFPPEILMPINPIASTHQFVYENSRQSSSSKNLYTTYARTCLVVGIRFRNDDDSIIKTSLMHVAFPLPADTLLRECLETSESSRLDIFIVGGMVYDNSHYDPNSKSTYDKIIEVIDDFQKTHSEIEVNIDDKSFKNCRSAAVNKDGQIFEGRTIIKVAGFDENKNFYCISDVEISHIPSRNDA